MECPWCRNNAGKWIDSETVWDIFPYGDTLTSAEITTKVCAHCGFIVKHFKHRGTGESDNG